MKIAIDINGGEFAPEEVMKGVKDFITDHPSEELLLCTDHSHKKLYEFFKGSNNIRIFEFEHIISMQDHPLSVKKDKPHNTISGIMNLVAEKKADCAFSCGNSGAVIFSAADIIGPVNHSINPALLSFIPMYERMPLALFDSGALGNRFFDAEDYFFHLEEAADLYTKMFTVQDPSVKILNIGSESSKGTSEHKKLFSMLKESRYNFAGNIEGDELISDDVNIVITDGFSGNVALKILESFNEIIKKTTNNIDCLNDNNLLNFFKTGFSYESVGAALLLGIKGKVAVGHGKSNARAVKAGLETCLKYCKI